MRYERHAARALALVLLAATVLPVSALAAPADVDGSLTSIRLSGGDGATSAIEAVSTSGSPVSVSASQAKGSFEVVYQDESGSETTATVSAADPNAALYAKVDTGSSTLRVRQGPGTDYAILCSVRSGSFFAVTGKTDGWYQIACNGRTGYVSADYIVERTLDQILAEGDRGTVVDPDSGVPHADPADYDRALAEQIVDYALYRKYGWHGERTVSLVIPGLEGMAHRQAMMARLRSEPLTEIAGVAVTLRRDHLDGTEVDVATGAVRGTELVGADVLRYRLADGTDLLVRPSGTEPKIKIYILAKGPDRADCQEKTDRYAAWAQTLTERV